MLLKFAVKDFLDDRAFRYVSTKALENYPRTLDEFHTYCVENRIVNVGDVRPATAKSYLVLAVHPWIRGDKALVVSNVG